MKLSSLLLILLAALLVGCSKRHSVVGTWVQQAGDSGSFAYEIFKADGTCLSGVYVPPTDESSGYESQIRLTYRVEGNYVGVSKGNEVTKRYNLDGTVESHSSRQLPAYDIELVWESDDRVKMVIDGVEFQYERVDKLPSELRF